LLQFPGQQAIRCHAPFNVARRQRSGFGSGLGFACLAQFLVMPFV